ncbi:hypothetical protein [Saccharospirillum mangrovi]|uniref:hypothetical protein n=1 Tax=Saccharospirillum mangrovi TaxID=2161747 RepID=UPI000D37AAA3|nr:hypothetical protein [Saccharospirillum mangrovi]
MKIVVIALFAALGLYLLVAEKSSLAHAYCLQAEGLPSSAIEARLGKHYEVRAGVHHYEPTWIYTVIYGDDIGVKYNRQWRASQVSCGDDSA